MEVEEVAQAVEAEEVPEAAEQELEAELVVVVLGLEESSQVRLTMGSPQYLLVIVETLLALLRCLILARPWLRLGNKCGLGQADLFSKGWSLM